MRLAAFVALEALAASACGGATGSRVDGGPASSGGSVSGTPTGTSSGGGPSSSASSRGGSSGNNASTSAASSTRTGTSSGVSTGASSTGSGSSSGGSTATGSSSGTSGAVSIQVDFGMQIATLDANALGVCESAYGNGETMADDSLEQQRFRALGTSIMRVELQLAHAGQPDSGVMCAASGCCSGVGCSGSGDQLVAGIADAGAAPEIQLALVNYLPYSAANVALFASDAAVLVAHYNGAGAAFPSPRWIIGNEPDNKGGVYVDAPTYTLYFNAAVAAMKAVDSTIPVGGPATASFNTSYLQTFLFDAGSQADFVDFHKYGLGNTSPADAGPPMAATADYQSDLATLQGMILDAGNPKATMQVGEWNLNWNGTEVTYEPWATVWGASVLGHILNAGGLSLPYATKNGSLGLVFDAKNTAYGAAVDDPMPLYYAVGMYTGLDGSVARFGQTVVSATSSLASVEAFASDGPKALVVVNKDPVNGYEATFTLASSGTALSATGYRASPLTPFSPPATLGPTAISSGSFSAFLPAFSVTTFVVE